MILGVLNLDPVIAVSQERLKELDDIVNERVRTM